MDNDNDNESRSGRTIGYNSASSTMETRLQDEDNLKSRITYLTLLEEKEELQAKQSMLLLIERRAFVDEVVRRNEYLSLHNQPFDLPLEWKDDPNWKRGIHEKLLNDVVFVFQDIKESRIYRNHLWGGILRMGFRQSRSQFRIAVGCKKQSQKHRDSISWDTTLCKTYIEELLVILSKNPIIPREERSASPIMMTAEDTFDYINPYSQRERSSSDSSDSSESSSSSGESIRP